ncbi:MAG: nitrile hydratase accessory protein [Burkholderiaceae bacterium]
MSNELPEHPAAREALAAIPQADRDRVFAEPWQAQAFALALALQQRGVFTWAEWSDALGAQIKAAQAQGDPDTGETYYLHWLRTIEHLVQAKGLTDLGTLRRYQHAWQRAAERTPHGTPIVLADDDFGAS